MRMSVSSDLRFCEEKKVKDWLPSVFPSPLVSLVSLVVLKICSVNEHRGKNCVVRKNKVDMLVR